MPSVRNQLDLQDLSLQPGARTQREFQVRVEPVTLGGTPFEVIVAGAGAILTVQRIAGGHLVRIDLDATIYGPCARCLAEVALPVSASEEEFVPLRPEEWEEADLSPFIDDQVIDVDGLAREALVLSMPSRVLCDDSCPGLCPDCGAQVGTEECRCERDVADERWARLTDLSFDDEEDG